MTRLKYNLAINGKGVYLPRSIFLLGEKWRIKLKDEILHKDTKCFGKIVYRDKTIYLSRKQNHTEILNSLLHECQHFLNKVISTDPEKEASLSAIFWSSVFLQLNPITKLENGTRKSRHGPIYCSLE